MSVTPLDLGAIRRRHRRAMRVIFGVDDEAARWALLDCVLFGNPDVEAALEIAAPRLRRPGCQPVLIERHRAVVRMRNEGLTFQQIAERTGYANPAAARYAYESGVSKLTG